MKHLRLVVFSFLLFTVFDSFSQSNKDRQETINGIIFTLHQAEKGETIYSLCKQYEISQEELKKYNPTLDLKKGPKTGEWLKLPTKKEQTQTKATYKAPTTDFKLHVVQKKETVFSVSRLYNITDSVIYKYNPGSEKGIKEKDTLKILIIPEKIEKTTQETKKTTANTLKYAVEKRDNFTSLKRKFGVSKEELIQLNPELKEGLKEGSIINLPSNPKTKTLIGNGEKEQGLKQHVVAKKETLTSIAQYYGVDIDELKRLNPKLADGKLKTGEKLTIPEKKKEEAKTEVQKTDEKTVKPKQEQVEESVATIAAPVGKKTITRKEVFRITMFLPLYYYKNIKMSGETTADDTVSVSTEIPSYDRSLYSGSRNFLEFYEGALLAIDSLQKIGAKIELTIYDSESSIKMVDAALQNPKLLNSNLIIGPVDVSLQKNIAAFCYKNQIPFVSPVSPDNSIANNNPFYFLIYPPKDYIIRKTAEHVSSNFKNSNILVVNHWGSDKVKEALLSNLVKEKISETGNSTIKYVNYGEGGAAGQYTLRSGLKDGVENVVIMPATENRDEREAFLSRAINNLVVLSKEFKITLVGFSDYTRLESINTENYHQVNLQFLAPNFINYKQTSVNNFIKKYRQQFFGEPTVFSFRGYDVVWYFTKAFDMYGKNFIDKISNYDTPLLISDFDFKRTKELGGYMNNSLYIMNFTPEFDIVTKGRYSNGKFIKY